MHYKGTKTVVSEVVSGVQGTLFGCLINLPSGIEGEKYSSYVVCKISGFCRGVDRSSVLWVVT
jgi:hypothetical protein